MLTSCSSWPLVAVPYWLAVFSLPNTKLSGHFSDVMTRVNLAFNLVNSTTFWNWFCLFYSLAWAKTSVVLYLVWRLKMCYTFCKSRRVFHWHPVYAHLIFSVLWSQSYHICEIVNAYNPKFFMKWVARILNSDTGQCCSVSCRLWTQKSHHALLESP